MFKILRNQVGASMVQVMIAAGMIGGLSLVLSELMKQQAKTKLTAEMNTEVNMIHDLLRKSINNQEMCNASFGGVGLGDFITGIRLSTTSDKFFCKSREQFKNSKIDIISLRLLSEEEQKTAGAEFHINDEGTSEVVLEIIMEKKGKGYGGQTIKKQINFAARFGTNELLDRAVAADTGGDLAPITKTAIKDLITECESKKSKATDWMNVANMEAGDVEAKLIGKAGVEIDAGDYPFQRPNGTTLLLTCVVANSESVITECL